METNLTNVKLNYMIDTVLYESEHPVVDGVPQNPSDVINKYREVLALYVLPQLLKFEDVLPNTVRRELFDLRESFTNELDYVLDYLRSPAELPEHPYYVRLTKNSQQENTYDLVIVLNEGSLNFIEDSSSEGYKCLLQEILKTLYNNGVSNRNLLKYYMEVVYDPSKKINLTI